MDRGKEAARKASCHSNLRQIGRALQTYRQDYSDRLPPAAGWMDALQPVIQNDLVFRCATDLWESPNHRYSYAFNSEVSGASVKGHGAAADTAVVYDSSRHARNSADPYTSFLPRHHFGRQGNVLFLDGHVGRVARRPGSPD